MQTSRMCIGGGQRHNEWRQIPEQSHVASESKITRVNRPCHVNNNRCSRHYCCTYCVSALIQWPNMSYVSVDYAVGVWFDEKSSRVDQKGTYRTSTPC